MYNTSLLSTQKEVSLSEYLFRIKKAALLDMNKLRMTGFECFVTFVIRRAMHTPKGAARHR